MGVGRYEKQADGLRRLKQSVVGLRDHKQMQGAALAARLADQDFDRPFLMELKAHSIVGQRGAVQWTPRAAAALRQRHCLARLRSQPWFIALLRLALSHPPPLTLPELKFLFMMKAIVE